MADDKANSTGQGKAELVATEDPSQIVRDLVSSDDEIVIVLSSSSEGVAPTNRQDGFSSEPEFILDALDELIMDGTTAAIEGLDNSSVDRGGNVTNVQEIQGITSDDALGSSSGGSSLAIQILMGDADDDFSSGLG